MHFALGMQFKHYKISALEVDAAQCHAAAVRAIRKATGNPSNSKVVMTFFDKHGMKSKVSHGQLRGLGPTVESLCLKLYGIKGHPQEFTVTLQSTSTLDFGQLNDEIATGLLRTCRTTLLACQLSTLQAKSVVLLAPAVHSLCTSHWSRVSSLLCMFCSGLHSLNISSITLICAAIC